MPALNVDVRGLIVQGASATSQAGDGGDTAQREGMYAFGQWCRIAMGHWELPMMHPAKCPFSVAIRILETAPGIFVRHPDQLGFRSDPAHFSRDQQRPLVIACGAWNERVILWKMALRQIGRLGRYQNGDWPIPYNLGEYIRAFKMSAPVAFWPLYWVMWWPVLWFTDLFLIGNAIAIMISTYKKPDDVDDNNFILTLTQAYFSLPTPISWIARKLYSWFRPRNYGNSVILTGAEAGELVQNPVVGTLIWYHRAAAGGNPEIARLWRPIVERIFR